MGAPPIDDNHLLAALKPSERQRWFGTVRPETLARGTVLVTSGASVPVIWFPTGGLVMLEHLAHDGTRLELGAVGREGLIGAPGAPSGAVSPYAAVVRVAGSGYRLRAHDVAHVLREHAGFQQAVLAYLGQAVTRMAQAAHCLHAHPIVDRLARWLLLALDNSSDAVIEITHDELACALGSAREVVSRALKELYRARAVWVQQRRILVRNRARLEATACDCYAPPETGEDDRRARPGPSGRPSASGFAPHSSEIHGE